MENKGRWFILNTLTGQEFKVRDALEALRTIHGDEFGIYEVLVPTETVTQVRQGKKHTYLRKFYPGYIMLRLDLYDPQTRKMNDKIWYAIRETQGIIGFVGNPEHPSPMSQREVDDIMQQISTPEEKLKPVSIYTVGERVRIKEGAFESFDGQIEEIDAERGKLKLKISIFGRLTPVEVDFDQVERPEA